MPTTILHLSPQEERIVNYALNFLLLNWDEDNEEDLGMTEKEIRVAVRKIREGETE